MFESAIVGLRCDGCAVSLVLLCTLHRDGALVLAELLRQLDARKWAAGEDEHLGRVVARHWCPACKGRRKEPRTEEA